MSIKYTRTIKCRHCREEISFEVWQSLNADLNPEAAGRLTAGNLFAAACLKCRTTINIVYPLLYHDMTNNVMVQLAPDERTVGEFFENVGLFEKDMSGYKFRLVRDINELREKVLIFNLGLDDKVIELAKLIIYAIFQGERPELKVYAAYFESTPSWEIIMFTENGPIASYPLSPDMLTNISKKFQARIESSGENYIINRDWAKSVMFPEK